MVFQDNIKQGVSNTASGTTTNDYVAALTLPFLGYSTAIISLKNTHGANSLTYKLIGYYHTDGHEKAILTDVVLVFSDQIDIEITKPYNTLTLFVKSTIAATAATYTINYVLRQ